MGPVVREQESRRGIKCPCLGKRNGAIYVDRGSFRRAGLEVEVSTVVPGRTQPFKRVPLFRHRVKVLEKIPPGAVASWTMFLSATNSWSKYTGCEGMVFPLSCCVLRARGRSDRKKEATTSLFPVNGLGGHTVVENPRQTKAAGCFTCQFSTIRYEMLIDFPSLAHPCILLSPPSFSCSPGKASVKFHP